MYTYVYLPTHKLYVCMYVLVYTVVVYMDGSICAYVSRYVYVGYVFTGLPCGTLRTSTWKISIHITYGRDNKHKRERIKTFG